MIPVNTPDLSGNELKYLQECIESGWISSEGPFVKKFEKCIAKSVNRKFGIAVSNGSAALDIAIKSLGFNPGDEIIMPTFTIISPALSIIRCGAVPVLVDSCLDTWNMDVKSIEKKINSKTKAILVVHIYGLPVDMDPVIDLCKKYNLKLIEDSAEMHGQTYKNKPCGSFGDISIFSFYPNKHITTGEGGMIVCNDRELDEKCRKLRNLAFEPEKRRFVHNEIGWNYRMTNMQAALGVAQFERLESQVNRKREIGNIYNEGLSDLKELILPLKKTDYSENIYWVFGLIAKSENRCIEITKKLNSVGIGTRPFFWNMHEQPIFKKLNIFNNNLNYPNAEIMSRRGFYIPSGLGLKNSEIKTVITEIKKICK